MDELLDRVRKLMASGQTIEAIKLVRDETGLGLKEAKDAVERCAQGGSLGIAEEQIVQRAAPQGGAQVDSEIKALLDSGQKIEAIKMLRMRSGLDLKASKDIIDGLERASTGRTQSAVDRDGRGGGRRWVMVLLLVIAAAVAIYLMRPGA